MDYNGFVGNTVLPYDWSIASKSSLTISLMDVLEISRKRVYLWHVIMEIS
jgi:hypothetical protein